MNTEQRLKQLENRVLQLEQENIKLKSSYSIPYDNERALVGRGFVSSPVSALKGDGFVLPLTFNLTGGAETIQTPPFPYEYWQIDGVANRFIAVYEPNV
jgi:hypothetical protein